MKTMRFDIRCAVVLVALGVCTSQPVCASGVRSAIEAVNAEMSAAVAKGDGAGVAALYAADGQVMPAGSDVIRGIEAIRKFWQAALDSAIGSVELKTLEVFAQGSTATEVGSYELHDKAGKVVDHGKYIVVWRHEGGKWKLLRDMFSTNAQSPSK